MAKRKIDLGFLKFLVGVRKPPKPDGNIEQVHGLARIVPAP